MLLEDKHFVMLVYFSSFMASSSPSQAVFWLYQNISSEQALHLLVNIPSRIVLFLLVCFVYFGLVFQAVSHFIKADLEFTETSLPLPPSVPTVVFLTSQFLEYCEPCFVRVEVLRSSAVCSNAPRGGFLQRLPYFLDVT